MNTTPVSSKFFNSAPSFLVIRGRVHWYQGGKVGILSIGEGFCYRKHGAFIVEYVGTSYAVIHHTTVRGEVRKVFIPPQKRLFLSNGHYELWDVNYQSFLDSTAEDGTRILSHARSAS